MLVIVILFFIAITLAFGTLYFRAWEIRTAQAELASLPRKTVPEIYFRHVEKIMLHLAKHAIQWIVLVIVKYWFIIYTKAKNWGGRNWPKVYRMFKKKEDDGTPQKYTFVQRAILELRAKIRHTKEKVRREHGEEITPVQQENTPPQM